MKVNAKIISKRHDGIIKSICKSGNVSVRHLMNEFSISEITIHRELRYCEDRCAIGRYCGGAKVVQQTVNQNSSNFTNADCKHTIAKKAASYVNEGDTIFINTSSTAIFVLQYIINKRCTIITNNAKISAIDHDPLISIVLTDGKLRFPKEAMVGNFALNNLRKVRANKCYLCVGEISQRKWHYNSEFSRNIHS